MPGWLQVLIKPHVVAIALVGMLLVGCSSQPTPASTSPSVPPSPSVTPTLTPTPTPTRDIDEEYWVWFLDNTDGYAKTSENKEAIVEAAHAICKLLDAGHAVKAIKFSDEDEETADDLPIYILGATKFYCPAYTTAAEDNYKEIKKAKAEKKAADKKKKKAAAEKKAEERERSSSADDDDSGGGGGESDSGYNGPRCYDPGGVTWQPC